MIRKVIAIAGPSGSGKTTTAEMLAKALKFRSIDTGQIFRKMAEECGMDVIEFGQHTEKNPEIDRELDERLINVVKRSRNGIIIQGRMAAWMCDKYDIPALKVWINANAQVRAKRVSQRENKPYRETLSKLAKRDRENRARYLKTYGLDLNDLSIYDVVIDTSDLSVEQVAASLIKKLPKIWLKK